MSTAQTVTLTIHVNTTAITRAVRAIAPDLRRLDRRIRRYRTHVWETPQASRIHAAYRAKTRRRNRR